MDCIRLGLICGYFVPLLSVAQVTANRNAVVSNMVMKPGVTTVATINTLTVSDRKQSVQYVDGLGRPLQTVLVQAGTGNRDIITPVAYDEYGREIKKLKPYADLNSGSPGSFRVNGYSDQTSYYANVSADGAKDAHPYAQAHMEFAPLGRVSAAGAPGQTWQPGGKTVSYSYLLNTLADSVRVFKVTGTSELGTYTTSSIYTAGDLTKVVATDEHGKQVVEFKDKEGKVVLKKVQLTANPDPGSGAGHVGWLCTYYIYDELNNLRGVVQPRGVQALSANSWVFNADIYHEQCFRYDYDAKRRMIVKKVPGAAVVYMVYDARDRVVMVQDGKLRAENKWLVTKYNSRNALIETGIGVNTSIRLVLQTAAWDVESYIPSTTAYEILTEVFYDNYSWTSGTGLTSTFDGSFSIYYEPANVWPYAQTPVASMLIRGKVTGTKTKVLGTSTFLYALRLYDDKGRVIQVKSTSLTGGTEVMTTQYTWSGQPFVSILQMKNSSNVVEQTIVSRTTYTAQGAVDKIEKRIQYPGVNGGAMGAWVTLSKMEYTQLGLLKKKSVGYNAQTAAYLESMDYEYNIRDWLLGANRNYLNDNANTSGRWFGFELSYDNTTSILSGLAYTQGQFNGNIAGTTWKSKGDQERRRYNFQYDAANRITAANFGQLTGGTFVKNQGIDFTADNYSYDANGNILSMRQYGWKLNGSVVIDSLLYTYKKSGLSNQLQNVIDRTNDAQTKLGDFRTSQRYLTLLGSKTTAANDYDYDVNGNLTQDLNKDIAAGAITYNHLNLPVTIAVLNTNGTPKGTITYTYDASGNKLRKVVAETGQPVKTTLYRAGSVYENDVLQFSGHEEGRYRVVPVNGATPAFIAFDYFLKDHLGNVRMVLTTETKTDMYPAATMETAQAATEEALYTNLSSTRIAKPANYPADPYTNPNDLVARVQGDAQRIGPSKLLKVMAGDQFSFRVSSWYRLNGVTPSAPSSLLNNLVNVLASLVGVLPSTKGTVTELTSSNAFVPGATSFVNTQNGYTSSRPKAFVNWVLLDEQFKYVSNGSGFEQVGADQVFTVHTRTNLGVSKSGYLYIYVSNETPNVPVFFDNLQVTHVRGPLLEETHYYPFGLTMAGISSRALSNSSENKVKFQGQHFASREFDDGAGLNMYEFKWRMHDPQSGRFWQVDPLAEKYLYNSTYAFSENKVTSHVELEGLEAVPTVGSRGVDGKYPVQGDVDNSGVVDSQERNSWISATGSWLNVGFYAGLMALLPGVGIPATVSELSGVPVIPSPQAMSSQAVLQSVSNVANSTDDVVQLQQRANQIQEVLSPATQRRTTTAVASATTPEGASTTLVASSEITLRPAQRAALKPGEVPVSGKGHAEVTILNHAKQNGMTVTAVAASRPICSSCATAIKSSGALPASPLKVLFNTPTSAASTYIKPKPTTPSVQR